jgi:hypothetical protein
LLLPGSMYQGAGSSFSRYLASPRPRAEPPTRVDAEKRLHRFDGGSENVRSNYA